MNRLAILTVAAVGVSAAAGWYVRKNIVPPSGSVVIFTFHQFAVETCADGFLADYYVANKLAVRSPGKPTSGTAVVTFVSTNKLLEVSTSSLAVEEHMTRILVADKYRKYETKSGTSVFVRL